MTEPDTSTQSPPALPILEGGEYDKYMLRTPAEAMTVLRGLRDRRAQITIFFNEGRGMLLTLLLAIARDHLVFDVGPDEELNRRAVAADRHYCVALLDKVRIQFLLGAFAPVTHEGRPAFLSAAPKELLRLQRREFYRLPIPVARPLKCRMPLLRADGSETVHEAGVFDISGGGIGIAAPPEDIPFEVDLIVPDCRIELPEVGNIDCTLRVCQLGISYQRSQTLRRAGCEFVDLPEPLATLIQRYIVKVERERKARESGLGF